MEHSKHIIRAVLLLVLITMAFVLVRNFAIPASFGKYGHYRPDSVREYADSPTRHGGPDGCIACHDEQGATLSAGGHSSVSCEVCHAPLADHVEDDAKVADMPVNRSVDLCAWCHQRLVARPKDFPQVVLLDHVAEADADMHDEVCLDCHDAHNPME